MEARSPSPPRSPQAAAAPATTVAADTRAPSPDEPGLAGDDDAYRSCGRRDARLEGVARGLAEARLGGELDLSRTSERMRLAGVPHAWPRVWLVRGRDLSWAKVKAPLEAFRGETKGDGVRLCGLALVAGRGQDDVAVAVTTFALVHLTPIPTTSRTGAWLTIDATLLAPTRDVRVILVGPDEVPQAVPVNSSSEHLRARFALRQPGRFVAQIVGDVGGGPRPLAEALIFADVAPFELVHRAPGEGELAGSGDANELFRLVSGLRRELGLGSFTRDRQLDAIAEAHLRRMRARDRVAHDVGDGDPKERLEQAGVVTEKAGENVARAETVLGVHRALYASPSHRQNLVDAAFTRLGVAVSKAPDGSVWAVQLFAR